EIRLEESGGGLKKPGGSAHLSCRTTGFPFSGYWMSWVRQGPGKGLEWVARMHPTDSAHIYYSNAVRGRFIISRDNTNSLLYLQMNGLKPEDTAVYYCARDTHNMGNLPFWGESIRHHFQPDREQGLCQKSCNVV
uniref:Ig-like domain-containing protein n=1 Tax=Anolis carolinensis TaxID=28377 RepID=H9GQ47_ANOCA